MWQGKFMNPDKVKQLAKAAGFCEIGELHIADLSYDEWVRELCEGNSCRNYNTSWACPPAVGTLKECKERCESYEQMFLFNKVYAVKNCFDIRGMRKAMYEFKDTVEAFNRLLELPVDKRLLLSNEGCGRCETCTWPDSACRFPEKLCHSLEGYGFNVTELAKKAGMKYNNGDNTVTFFGAVLLR